MPRVTRAPSHAKSWYAGEAEGLGAQIDGWLESAEGPSEGEAGARAIIAP
jgi:predicted class III extradiol MEMO1 family dioxygenase